MKKFRGIIPSYIQQTVANATSPNDLTEEEIWAWVNEVDSWEPRSPFSIGMIYSIDSSRAHGRPPTCTTRNGTDGCPSSTYPIPTRRTMPALVTSVQEIAQVEAPSRGPNVFMFFIVIRLYFHLIFTSTST